MTAGKRYRRSQPGWNIYEAALIFDGYLEIFQEDKPRDEIVQSVSSDLRQMAINRGRSINSSYRNENGVSYHMQRMDSAYKGEKGSTPAAKLFEKIIELYRTDTRKYFEILNAAKNMAVPVQNKEPSKLWDIYEIVILLAGYLEISQENKPRDEIVQRVSADLRQMALNRGKLIDSTYRNEKAIASRMYVMASAYKGKNKSAPAPRLFTEAVTLYLTEQQKYFEILNEAKTMAAPVKNTEKQTDWDIYEAAILLEGYFETFRDNKQRDEVIKRVSADLRQIAINRGITIDSDYRNGIEIICRLYSMDSAYKGKNGAIPASRLFTEMVEMYRTDTKKYLEILHIAKNMALTKQHNRRQPSWDLYEAAILLEGYLEVYQDKKPRDEIIKRVSADLRRMSLNRGMTIDNAYRNESSISSQMYSMDSAYKGKNASIPATKLFKETVEMFRTDTRRYFEILNAAKTVAGNKRNKRNAFLTWAASALAPKRCKWIEESLFKIEEFAISSKLMSGSIYEVADMPTLENIRKAVVENINFRVKYRKRIRYMADDFTAYMQFCSQLPEMLGESKTAATSVRSDRK